MRDAGVSDRLPSSRIDVEASDSDPARSEAAEVADLLTRAGVDHASALWFQMLELATQKAHDWTERSLAACASMSRRTAAILGLRALAAEILSAAPDETDAARGAAEACLNVCADTESAGAPTITRRRRWGEGAAPAPSPRPGPLDQRIIGCC